MTYCKLPSDANWRLLVGHLALQLGQDTPQNPGLLLHGWLCAAWDRVRLRGMSGHKGPFPWIMEGGPRRNAVGPSVAARLTSLMQVPHQGTAVTEHMNCHRGSKSQFTGSVVRLKI